MSKSEKRLQIDSIARIRGTARPRFSPVVNGGASWECTLGGSSCRDAALWRLQPFNLGNQWRSRLAEHWFTTDKTTIEEHISLEMHRQGSIFRIGHGSFGTHQRTMMGHLRNDKKERKRSHSDAENWKGKFNLKERKDKSQIENSTEIQIAHFSQSGRGICAGKFVWIIIRKLSANKRGMQF